MARNSYWVVLTLTIFVSTAVLEHVCDREMEVLHCDSQQGSSDRIAYVYIRERRLYIYEKDVHQYPLTCSLSENYILQNYINWPLGRGGMDHNCLFVESMCQPRHMMAFRCKADLPYCSYPQNYLSWQDIDSSYIAKSCNDLPEIDKEIDEPSSGPSTEGGDMVSEAARRSDRKDPVGNGSVWMIIAICSVAVLIVLIVVLIIIFFMKRRLKPPTTTSTGVTTPGIDNPGYGRDQNTARITRGSNAYEEINDDVLQSQENSSNEQETRDKGGVESDYVVASDDYAVTFTENEVYH